MTLKGSKLLFFLSFLAFVVITLFFISSPAFANHNNNDKDHKNDSWKKDWKDNNDKKEFTVNLSGGTGGTTIINNNENKNKNENKNVINIATAPVRAAAVPATLPATGAPIIPTLALLAALPLGLKLRKFKS